MLSSYTQIGQNHLHFKEIDSTNNYAINLLAKTNPIDGTVISADFQSAGKGQYDRKWLSNSGENIIMSIILYPDFLKAQQQIYLNMAIALAIVDFLNNFNNDFAIKWPNDIYHQNSKIAGILIQNQLQGESIKNSVIGVGLNLNQISFENQLLNPISLSLITGQTYDISHQMELLIQKINRRYNLLQAPNQLQKIKSDFDSKLYGIDSWVQCKYIGQDTYESVKVLGVSVEGKLIVETANKTIKELVHGEVEIQYQKNNSIDFDPF